MKKFTQILLFFWISFTSQIIWAATPEPIDPRESVNFTFEERLAQTKKLHALLKSATSTERLNYFDKSIEAIKKLSTEERRSLSEKFREQWKKLSAEQKKEIKLEYRNYISSLPDFERKEMKRKRKMMLEFISPEDIKHWK